MRRVTLAGIAMLLGMGSALAQTTPQMCDPGVFGTTEKIYNFEDIVAEGTDAVKLNEQGTVLAGGYLVWVRMGVELNDNVTAQIGTISSCSQEAKMAAVKSNQLIDVVFARSDFSDETWKETRRLLLTTGDGLSPQALVGLWGKFEIAQESYELYFRAKTAKVLARFD